jgi:hypothetical protein
MAAGNGKDAGGIFFMGMVGDLSRTSPSMIHCEFESILHVSRVVLRPLNKAF